MNDWTIHEDLIKITDYQLAGPLPNPFVFDDGTPVKTPADWTKRRQELYKSAVELQYGTIPPKPEFLEVELLSLCNHDSYRIHTGTREKPFTMSLHLFLPKGVANPPVVVDGDFCFRYCFDEKFINTFLDNGIALAMFNRTELAPDVSDYDFSGMNRETPRYQLGREILDQLETHNCGGVLKQAYPDYTFGAVGAWAWGYSRVVDALDLLGAVDMSKIVFTGHSRGGKTALLAGVLDERAAIVNPNEACAGGSGNYRLSIRAIPETGKERPSEPLCHIFKMFPAWMGKDLKEYIGKEEQLPFDSHFLKAMVAPRVLLVGEAASDIWANPVGSWQTTMAAKEVYKFLGCEENLIWYFRNGIHYHTIGDLQQLVNVIKHTTEGEPLNDKYFKLPFKPMELPYSWRCPE